jgi:regulatory protein
MKSTETISIKSKALSFLARREHAYSELFTKLQRYTDNLDEIHTILDDLKQKGWLSEERYVAGYISAKKNKYGSLKIRYNLQQKKVDPDLVEQILNQNASDEYQIAHKIWQRKFGDKTPNDTKEKMRQSRFLQSRGFSYDIIMRIINK